METYLFNRLHATLLAVATVGLFALAVMNFRQESQFQQPDDGVWWSETAGVDGLEAVKVLPGGPGQLAGIKVHDLLTGAQVLPDRAAQRVDMQAQEFLPATRPNEETQAKQPAEIPANHTGIQSKGLQPQVNYTHIRHVADLEHVLYRTEIYGKAGYALTRNGIPLETQVIPEPTDRSLALGLRIIGLVYLAIGIYVLFRRWTAPRATHFYLFCLVSFALYALKYTGAMDAAGHWDKVDQTVFWFNVLAESLQPALFLHFALSFPEERLASIRRRWLLPVVYAPGAALLGLWLFAFEHWQATGLLNHRLDQTGTAYDAIYYVLAASLFVRSYRQADTPLLRQQLKWLMRGALLAVVPFTLLLRHSLPVRPEHAQPAHQSGRLLAGHPAADLQLGHCPLPADGHRPDLQARRGLHAGHRPDAGRLLRHHRADRPGGAQRPAAIGARVGPGASRLWSRPRSSTRSSAASRAGWTGSSTAIATTIARRWWSSAAASVRKPNLQALLESIVERLPRTLLVARVAVFLAQEPAGLQLAAAHGLPPEVGAARDLLGPNSLDLGFLDFDQAADHSHIFLENAQQALHLPENQRRAAALLDLNYYLPCRVQDGSQTRTIAVIGLGRTIGGDFLSSEDVELLESLASYIGIALQNASLYARLEEKIGEFERLKEFNENIVESINVGILAIDLDDRIESWNAQMEAMYALSRAEALGQPLHAVFPLEFIEALEGFRNEHGVHHLYKFRLTTRAGEQRTANIAIAPLLSRDFVSVGRIILVDDITERVSLEAQLAQADKLSSIGLLAAGVAHEINTPLAVISSYAQMLSKQLKGDARLGPVLDKITQQSFRAAEIANGLLNFSRTSTTEFRDTNLNQVIRDTLSLLEHQFKTAKIAVDLDLADDLPSIHGNPGKLQQVFLNLLLNAKEAMPGGGNCAWPHWPMDTSRRWSPTPARASLPST